MKVCILSDSHDQRSLLFAAAVRAKQMGVAAILHCGDIVPPSTLAVLQSIAIAVHVIHGNNGGDLYLLARSALRAGSLLRYHGHDAALRLYGRCIFLVYYPHYGEAMATTGDWDLVCCGHSHVAEICHISNVKGGVTTLVNPGTVGVLTRRLPS